MIGCDPRLLGFAATRWTLALLGQACSWLGVRSAAGIHGVLGRLGIAWKRGRGYLHSPDPAYQAKVAQARALVELARTSAGRIVVLYQDECAFYRQPSLANAWGRRGRYWPLARLSYRTNTPTRIVCLLDVSSGRLIYRRAKSIGLTHLVHLYRQVQGAYPQAQRIYIILDNWPVHFHPDVLVALEAQENPWPWHRPGNWSQEANPSAVRRYGGWHLPIQLVPLPTYAPWTNPVEKVWRQLKGEVLHLHPLADDLEGLRSLVDGFFAGYAHGSDHLLHYVGLLTPD